MKVSKETLARIAAARATGKIHPDTEYRVTLMCRCSNDFAEGYGPDAETARAVVEHFWRRDGHRKADIKEVVVECANGGSHYERVQP